MSPRIGIARVAASRHLYLVPLIDVRIVSPRRRARVRAHMSALERIGRPERRHHRGIVEDSIVPLPCVSGAYHILRAFLSRSELEPILIHRRPCRLLGLEDHRRGRVEGLPIRRVLSRTRYDGVCLEDIVRTRIEAREGCAESTAVGARHRNGRGRKSICQRTRGCTPIKANFGRSGNGSREGTRQSHLRRALHFGLDVTYLRVWPFSRGFLPTGATAGRESEIYLDALDNSLTRISKSEHDLLSRCRR